MSEAPKTPEERYRRWVTQRLGQRVPDYTALEAAQDAREWLDALGVVKAERDAAAIRAEDTTSDYARAAADGNQALALALRAADADLGRLRARVAALESTLASRHGGEPLALLEELTVERGKVRELEAEVERLRDDRMRLERAADAREDQGSLLPEIERERDAAIERAETAENELSATSYRASRLVSQNVAAAQEAEARAARYREALEASAMWMGLIPRDLVRWGQLVHSNVFLLEALAPHVLAALADAPTEKTT